MVLSAVLTMCGTWAVGMGKGGGCVRAAGLGLAPACTVWNCGIGPKPRGWVEDGRGPLCGSQEGRQGFFLGPSMRASQAGLRGVAGDGGHLAPCILAAGCLGRV